MVACLDWKERFYDGRSLVPWVATNEGERSKAIRTFDRLRIPDVIGMPTNRDATGDWIRDVVAALFGSYNPETNRRGVQEAFLLVPKKNGKSSLSAAIMITAMIMNRRPSAEFLLIAPTKEIADIAFRQAAGIIKADDVLVDLFHEQRHIRTITHRQSGAILQIKAADTDVITGSKSTGILVDETHVFASKPRAADVFVEVRGALAARPDGFMIQITTQSKKPPAGVFKAELSKARAVRDGEIDLPMLPVLYEFPETAEDGWAGWKEETAWGLVNPNLGKSVDPQFLRNQMIDAEREGPEKLALIASQHFNVQIGTSLHADRWAGTDYWQGAALEIDGLDDLLERCEVCTIGIDGGGLDDLLGLAVIGRERKTRRWLVWFKAWADEGVLNLRKEIAPRLEDFREDGDLSIVDMASGANADVSEVADIVEQVWQAGMLPEKYGIGLDSVGVATIVDEIVGRDIPADCLVAVSQGYRLSGTIKGAARKLKDGSLKHCGQPMGAWCVSNAKQELKGSAVLITKQASGTAKIDPLMAMFNAFDLMSRNPESSAGHMIDYFEDLEDA